MDSRYGDHQLDRSLKPSRPPAPHVSFASSLVGCRRRTHHLLRITIFFEELLAQRSSVDSNEGGHARGDCRSLPIRAILLGILLHRVGLFGGARGRVHSSYKEDY